MLRRCADRLSILLRRGRHHWLRRHRIHWLRLVKLLCGLVVDWRRRAHHARLLRWHWLLHNHILRRCCGRLNCTLLIHICALLSLIVLGLNNDRGGRINCCSGSGFGAVMHEHEDACRDKEKAILISTGLQWKA
jgi:hypothetical protein